MTFRRLLASALMGGLAVFLRADDVPLKNWPVLLSAERTLEMRRPSQTQTLVSTPVAFQAMVPCRIVDTRQATGTFGGPSLAIDTARNFPIPTSTACTGIPTSAAGYSLNVTVTNTGAQAFGFLKIWPQDATEPNVSTLNYPGAGATLANAAIVPAGTSGGITVKSGNATTDLIIDINGFFVSTLPSTSSFSITSPGSQAAIVGLNTSTSTSAFGVTGQTNSTGNGSAGLFASATAVSGRLYGVLGQESSTGADSAGVRGVDGTGSVAGTFTPSGVRGESLFGVGVLGLSQTLGVRGDLLSAGGATQAEGILGYTTGGNNYGVYAVGDIGATGTKFFVTPHPTDPSQVIRYVALEGPEVGTYCRGRGQLQGRLSIIDLPESFRLVTEEDGLSVQITPIGAPVSLWIQSVGTDRIVVRGPKDVEFFYAVNGVRKGFAEFQAMAAGSEFVPSSAAARIPEGLSDEARRRLVANGTFNEDGTVNMETARRLGWTKNWDATSARRSGGR